MIAALYVQMGGVYYGLSGVDPWGEDRDARLYPGPYPVVAHPDCARWGNYWFGSPSGQKRFELGDDDGRFQHAAVMVRKYGGVLEHPAGSRAWLSMGFNAPPSSGGWVSANLFRGWTCHVEQGHYGHRARKATWLYAYGVDLPSLKWGPSERTEKLENLSKKQRAATPIEFRDLLISIAETASRREAAA